MVFELPASGGAATLYSFPPATYGSYAQSGLTQDAQGNLYGTTVSGGTRDWGVLYKLTPAGDSVLHNYQYTSGGGGLSLDSAGNLYGTSAELEGSQLVAYLFRRSPAGQFTMLHACTGGGGGVGCYGVIPDPAGDLYGASGPGKYGDGLIFKLSPSGEYTVLHSFTGGADGNSPNNALTLDPAGNLYGMTNGGGIGAGVVFKITPAGAFSVLYTFTAYADGGYPLFGVVLDKAGNLYGTTAGYGELAGGKFGQGVVFELETGGTYKVLYTFTGGADGGGPGSLVRDSAGNLYGTTENDGDSQCDVGAPGGCGVVFQLTPSGVFSVLHAFTGGADGGVPYAGPILGLDGSLYGTTGRGGTANAGVVYKIMP